MKLFQGTFLVVECWPRPDQLPIALQFLVPLAQEGTDCCAAVSVGILPSCHAVIIDPSVLIYIATLQMYLCYEVMIKAVLNLDHIPSKCAAMFMKDVTPGPFDSRVMYNYEQGYIYDF